jgi:hypothetical protein
MIITDKQMIKTSSIIFSFVATYFPQRFDAFEKFRGRN